MKGGATPSSPCLYFDLQITCIEKYEKTRPIISCKKLQIMSRITCMRRGWRSGKISAFQPQGPGFKSRLCRVLNICVTFFSAKVDSAFHPYGVGKMSTSFCWGLTCDGLVSRPGGVNDSHPLNTTETGDKHRLRWATWLGKGFSFC